MGQVIRIGNCAGCGTMGKLNDDGCHECLRKNGPAWIMLAKRARTDPAFAAKCYAAIPDERRRHIFVQLFGLPKAIG